MTGEQYKINECYDTNKSKSLIHEIEEADISEDEKMFLKFAAYRHNQFNYKKIAEYYANASEEMQELMERSALVIIDYDDAIRNGYVKLSSAIDELKEERDDA